MWKYEDVEHLSMTSEFVRIRRPSSLPAFRLASKSAEALIPERCALQLSTAGGCTISNLTESDQVVLRACAQCRMAIAQVTILCVCISLQGVTLNSISCAPPCHLS